MLLSGHLSVGALSQDFEQLELRGVGLLTSLLHVVADVDLLQYAVVLGREREQRSTGDHTVASVLDVWVGELRLWHQP